MNLFKALYNHPSSLSAGTGPSVPIILSTRLRLARNLADCPFPGWAKETQRRDTLSQCKAALQGMDILKGAYLLKMSDLSELEKQVLVERHLISKELSSSTEGSAVIISKDGSCAVMINEEDHLRIQILQGGIHLKKIWKIIDQLDTKLEERLNYAFSSELGYLTACPTNVGTAMRASAMLHLPGLVLAGLMEKVIRAINQLGMTVRGLLGEGSDSTGSIFQVSNQQTLGESEEEIIKKLTSVLQTVIEQEENARARLIEEPPLKIADKLGRAYGVLQNSYIISSTEAMSALSLMRLAVDLNILPEEERSQIDRLFIQCQPAHIQFATENAVDSNERDHYRSSLLRKHFQLLPPLNFESIHLKS